MCINSSDISSNHFRPFDVVIRSVDVAYLGRCHPSTAMITTSKNWIRRNRTNLGITVGVLGAGYVVCQYVLSKIAETGERMDSGRTAKEKYISPLGEQTR